MGKINLTGALQSIGTSISRHSPEILMSLGIAGFATTAILSAKATPVALEKIKKAKEEKHVDKLAPIDTFKITWKYFAPAVVLGVTSAACIIGANSVNMRRNAALMTAYKLSETALTEYREQVVETVGEKKEKLIRDEVNKKQIEKTPLNTSEVYITGKGGTLCLDPLSKRYFRYDIDLIRKAENTINKQILHDLCGTATVNDFYDEISLDRTDIGDHLEWDTDNLIDLNITPGISPSGEPCLVIGHYNAPKYCN